jgi:hypothetical protein
MKMEKHISDRILRNVFLSLFIYALPVLLMLLTFYINGERPWKNPKPHSQHSAQNSK